MRYIVTISVTCDDTEQMDKFDQAIYKAAREARLTIREKTYVVDED